MKNRFHNIILSTAAMVMSVIIALSFSACTSSQPESESPPKNEPAVATTAAMDVATPPAAESPVSPAAVSVATTPAAATEQTTTEAAAKENEEKTSTDQDSKKNEGDSDNSADKKNTSSKTDKDKDKNKDKSKDTSKDKGKSSKPKASEEPQKSETPQSGETPKPDDKPAPKPEDDKITVSVSVDCLTLHKEDSGMSGQVSKDGIILGKKNVTVKKDATVFDVLKASGASYSGKEYISSIGGLSEFDAGPESGWVFLVNGTYSSVGVTKYTVKNGDYIQFRYTLNGGTDVK
jgi:hypothetical protein